MMNLRRKLPISLTVALALCSVGAGANAQQTSPDGTARFIPQIQAGLQEASTRMSGEAYTGCFVTAVFVNDFVKRAKSQATGQSMAEFLESFACESSEKAGDDRYLVDGTLTVNGESALISSEIVQVQRTESGSAGGSDRNWAVGRVLLGGREIFRDQNYKPAN